MAAEKTKRKLTTILSADVKGYSRLMGEDEEWTVRTLKGYKEVMGNLIQQHRGRVVDAIGDNLMAEFASVVDAVECGVEIQQALRAKNALLPETRRVEFRIGINLGDVIEDGERIYGDGVNIAARLEGLAQAGGICISESAYQQIENKLPLRYEDLGEHQFKNIAKPVRVYRAQIEPEAADEKKAKPRQWQRPAIGLVVILIVVVAVVVIWKLYTSPAPKMEAASEEQMALPLPDKPSIAVLAFDNLSGDPKQEYFSDGITEEIITGLSKMPKLFVIARNSSFTFKGKAVNVQEVGRKLGVSYVLEGSVRKEKGQVRITVQLIDAQTGGHVWSERYNRDLRDIFALQDEVTLAVIRAMRVKLTDGEQAALWQRKGLTNNLEAFEKYLQGRDYSIQMTARANDKARQLYEEAIALDPGFAMVYAKLAWTHMLDVNWGWSKDRRESARKAYETANKALTLDDSLDSAHYILGSLHLFIMHQHDKAIAEGERGVELNPNGHEALFALGVFLTLAGRPAEAITVLNKAIRLNPMPPAMYYGRLGDSYRLTNQIDKAIATLEKGLRVQPDNTTCLLQLAAAYSQADRQEDASRTAAEFRRLNPKWSLETYAKIYKDPAAAEQLVNALKKAGL